MYRYHQVLDKTFHHHQTLKMDLKPFTIKSLYDLFEVYLFVSCGWYNKVVFSGLEIIHSWTSTTTQGSQEKLHIPLIVLCAWYGILY
jgi:hypothetical protein